MTYHSRKAIVSIVTSIIIFVYLYIDIIQKIQAVGAESYSVPKLWGTFYFKLIAVTIVAKIIIMIVFNIINRIATNEREPSFTDERDRLIELKAVRNFCFIFCFGFFIAMGLLVINKPISMMFNIQALVIAVAGVVLDLSYIVYYERGF
jgi:hypothetical protein